MSFCFPQVAFSLTYTTQCNAEVMWISIVQYPRVTSKPWVHGQCRHNFLQQSIHFFPSLPPSHLLSFPLSLPWTSPRLPQNSLQAHADLKPVLMVLPQHPEYWDFTTSTGSNSFFSEVGYIHRYECVHMEEWCIILEIRAGDPSLHGFIYNDMAQLLTE